MPEIAKYAPHARNATERARARVGDPYHPGWCLRFVAHDVLGVSGVGDWEKMQAEGYNNVDDYWAAAVDHGKVVKTSDPAKIPAGSIVAWSGGEHGHAAYALGDGKIIGTDHPTHGRVGESTIKAITDDWDYKLLGAVLIDGGGYTYHQPAKRPARKYKVTAADGAPGHTSRSKSAPVGETAKSGATLTVNRLEQEGFIVWAVASKKDAELYYLADQLERA
jgi:hypothetical protein